MISRPCYDFPYVLKPGLRPGTAGRTRGTAHGGAPVPAVLGRRPAASATRAFSNSADVNVNEGLTPSEPCLCELRQVRLH